MATEVESAHLILKLYELRREPLLRQARAWYLNEFNPTTMEELTASIVGERNAWFRMVLGYWEMAASLVTFGAIDAKMFAASNNEIITAFAKVEPFLAYFRQCTPDYLNHLETVARQMPHAAEYVAMIQQGIKALAAQKAINVENAAFQ
jgi:hypothetical protein